MIQYIDSHTSCILVCWLTTEQQHAAVLRIVMRGLSASCLFAWFVLKKNIWKWCLHVISEVYDSSIILGCPVVDHLTIITRIDKIGKLYGQRLTYLHNLQRGYCMQNYIKPQSRKKYRRNSDFYNSWSTCHPTWRCVWWSISTAHARISREKSFCINYDNYV